MSTTRSALIPPLHEIYRRPTNTVLNRGKIQYQTRGGYKILLNHSSNIVLPLYLFLPQEKKVFVYTVLTNHYIVLLFSLLALLVSVHLQHQSRVKLYLYSKNDSIYFGIISFGHL